MISRLFFTVFWGMAGIGPIVMAQCNGTSEILTDEKGVIQSPNYPDEYNWAGTCSWEFPPKVGKMLLIHVTDVELFYWKMGAQKWEQICTSTLQIGWDNAICTSPSRFCHAYYAFDLRVSCNRVDPEHFEGCTHYYSSNPISIGYATTGEYQGKNFPKGFRLEYKFVSCEEDETTTAPFTSWATNSTSLATELPIVSTENAIEEITSTTVVHSQTDSETTTEEKILPENAGVFGTTNIIIIAVCAAILLIIIVIAVMIFKRRKRNQKSPEEPAVTDDDTNIYSAIGDFPEPIIQSGNLRRKTDQSGRDVRINGLYSMQNGGYQPQTASGQINQSYVGKAQTIQSNHPYETLSSDFNQTEIKRTETVKSSHAYETLNLEQINQSQISNDNTDQSEANNNKTIQLKPGRSRTVQSEPAKSEFDKSESDKKATIQSEGGTNGTLQSNHNYETVVLPSNQSKEEANSNQSINNILYDMTIEGTK
ncbi:uncharacterized protein LOC144424402 [Styela clava]